MVDIHDLALARERGVDLVGVGALVQRPLAAVIARGSVRRPRDLEGRRVGVTGLPSDDAVLRAVLEHDGASLTDVRRVTIGFSAVPSLIAGRVDAVVAFWNAEGVTLRRRGVDTREFRVGRYGVPPYPELVLATTRRTLDEHRDLVRGTVAALRDGTEEALSDPPTAVSEVAKASGEDEDVVRAQFDALAPAFRPPLVLRRDALRAWARFDVRFGILEPRARPRPGVPGRLAGGFRRSPVTLVTPPCTVEIEMDETRNNSASHHSRGQACPLRAVDRYGDRTTVTEPGHLTPLQSPVGSRVRASPTREPLHERGGLARHARARHHPVEAGRLGAAAHVHLHVGVEAERR